MKIAIILNGISLQKKFIYHKFLPVLNGHFQVEVFETRTQHDAVALASKATEKRFNVILAAGGDGTVHQVANGILQERENSTFLPTLGVVPIGAGNDFARVLSLNKDPEHTIDLINKMQPHKIDVGKITYRKTPNGAEHTRFFINEVDMGMGPEVVQKVLASGRPFGSELTYYVAILKTFMSYKLLNVEVVTPEWKWQGLTRTVGIANGRYYGNGLCIAPEAQPDDGLFATFICGEVSVFDFMRNSGNMKKGKYIRIPNVLYSSAKTISLTSPEHCIIQADGELLGCLPAKIEMLPQILPVLY